MNKDTIILGLGNPLMGDEGIGTHLIEELQKQADSYPDVNFMDGGTGGMQLLHYIANKKKAIIIDCALMSLEPGTIKRFTPDQVNTVKKLAHLSLHEVDIIKVIELSQQLGECPDEVVFFGIEPEAIIQQMHLTETLMAKIPDYINEILKEITPEK
ncbi:MAG: HyaD/HybD family hydrogenase maturation endopeptidase [Phycisphaerae bacterium]|nr:HyaD/HybD family hydrogenase maturation endopeptidase [Phycisphaerae bacterium]